jgi:pyruvate dehydrogenase E2 component (dihydrolipoamide acetyltransferase)
MSDFLMPALGADMESGTLTEWLVEPGAEVKKGNVVAVVETHKGAIEVEIFEEGVISELVAREGDEVPVGGLLARLSRPGEKPEAREEPEPEKRPKVEKEPEQRPPPEAAHPEPAERPKSEKPAAPAPPSEARAKVSPAARRRAAELGVDPDALDGTGIDGSVTLADVEAAGHTAPPAARKHAKVKPGRAHPGFNPTEMRQAIAAAMSRSKREIPHYYLTTTIDMGRAQGWLEDYNRERPPEERLLPAVLPLKAAGLALLEVPQLNGFWKEGQFGQAERINIGWAIALRGGGLIAPAIRDVDKLSLTELMDALRDLVARARSGGLRSSELTDPSFTITSLGERGADSVIGVIYPPQVAILGLGRVSERPWVAEGEIVPRPQMLASLSGDHRASDGHTGGLFLSALDRLLQEPDAL